MAEAYENLAGRVEEIVYRNPDNGYTVLQLNTGEANGDGETVAGEIDSEVKRIVDEDGADMESAPHPKQVLYIDLGHPLEKYDILRRKE